MVKNMGKPEKKLSPEQDNILKKMLNEIARPEITAVSFRLKDALAVMPFSSPDDMFLLMETDFRKYSQSKKNFREIRTSAQEKALKKSGDISLESIYNIIAKTAKISDTKPLFEKECELAVFFTSARKCGKILYDEALKQKKKIIIVSEKIYPAEITEKILKKCGYNSYDMIIYDGNFSDIQQQSGAAPPELLHIGGNVEKDVEKPILSGSKALLLSPEFPLMVKSGRLRGFVQSEKLLEIDSPEYLALRCAFALYAIYAFDIPQNKALKSDFCRNPRMLGFMVFGALSLIENYEPLTDFQREILAGLEKKPEVIQGINDFKNLFQEYFRGYDMNFTGCEIPLIFLENHAAQSDRSFLRPCISDNIFKNWEKNITEPEILPVYSRAVTNNPLSRLVDKLFPRGTKVRTIADSILAKAHR